VPWVARKKKDFGVLALLLGSWFLNTTDTPISVFPLDLALPAIINNKTGDAGVEFHIFMLVVGG